MGSIATTVEDQIKLLQKRGLIIDDTNKAKEILLDIGYYRLGFYWNCLECDSHHNFTAGSRFSDAVSLYYLDVDLRELLLKYIYRIEVHFRTQIVYHVSNKYPHSPTWFIDNKVVTSQYVADFEKFYDDKFKKSNKPILKHHQKYINDKYAPAWKTIEFITFGGNLKLFRALKDPTIKQIISSNYSLKKVHILENFMQTVVYVRNMCSHGGVLYDLKQPKGINKIPNQNYAFTDVHSLDASIKVIRYLLSQISKNREVEMAGKITDLFNQFTGNPVIKKIIETKIKYKM